VLVSPAPQRGEADPSRKLQSQRDGAIGLTARLAGRGFNPSGGRTRNKTRRGFHPCVLPFGNFREHAIHARSIRRTTMRMTWH